MRYVVGFVLFLLALGTLRMVGCGDESAFCADKPHGTDCDDGDENDCIHGQCSHGVCVQTPSNWAAYDSPCQTGGVAGICLCGVCRVGPFECSLGQSQCEDDGNECTWDDCDPCTLSCGLTYPMDCYGCDREGVAGFCLDGVCETEPRCSSDEECDDGIACTDDYCDECRGCLHDVNCDDGNRCTDNECNLDTGECYYPNKPDGTWCGCARWEPQVWPPCFFGECKVCVEGRHCQNGVCR